MKQEILTNKQNGTIIIGIQVRIGDVAFQKGYNIYTDRTDGLDGILLKKISKNVNITNSNIDGVSKIENPLTIPKIAELPFACATNIGNRIIRSNRNVIYFLIKQIAKHIYGNQLITDLSYQPKHIYEDQTVDRVDKQHISIKQSASDMYLYSLSDIHVITRHSGFGQKAAYMSEIMNKIHIFYGDQGKNCSIGHTYSVAENWSGVR